MLESIIPIKRALISVSNKDNLLEFARGLAQLNIEIISTGGTAQYLKEANIPVIDAVNLTQFPEIMDGRVKTLHPKIHGGILGRRDTHADIAKELAIDWIDLVIVNLYPFGETIKNPNATFQDAIENIDIGGPAMIRSAAKNMEWAGVIVDPDDYSEVLLQLQNESQLTFVMRKQLAVKAFAHTADYDAMIYRYLKQDCPDFYTLSFDKKVALRYGENPHQSASAYSLSQDPSGVLAAKQYQGKELSFNNIVDADAAIACVREFSQPACVIVKHANPCGVAVSENINDAYQYAFSADPVSAFGGIVALNERCTQEIAEHIATLFLEVLIAPAFDEKALAILSNRTNLRVLELNRSAYNSNEDIKFITGGILVQEKDLSVILKGDLKVVTKNLPSDEDINTLLFAWPVLKHIKSNGILLAKDNVTVGIGAGQVSRIDAVDLAIRKAGNKTQGSILASDAFFPFRDSVDRMASTGIRAIVQPGGSVRDAEVISACDEHGIAMVFTGKRCFKH